MFVMLFGKQLLDIKVSEVRELGKSYSDKFIADDKEGAMAVAQTVVDAIAVKTKDAMTASQGL